MVLATWLDPALAFPGWTVGVVWGSTNIYQLFTLYNNLTLDSPAVDLIGPLFPNGVRLSSLQGSYSVVLQASAYFNAVSTLSQTGLVPADARSITFAISSTAGIYAPSVTLNGFPIYLVPVGGDRLAGDVTAFAGTTAQLTFTSVNWITYFDDVQFSNLPVPEPSVFGLSALGALLLGCAWSETRE